MLVSLSIPLPNLGEDMICALEKTADAAKEPPIPLPNLGEDMIWATPSSVQEPSATKPVVDCPCLFAYSGRTCGGSLAPRLFARASAKLVRPAKKYASLLASH